MEKYDINAIETLDFSTAVRMKIGMYLGSADMEGVYNSIQEIISNAVDEFYMGFGKKILISIDESTNLITICDFGRGVPFGIKEDGSNVLVDIYSRAHTGGKFNEKTYQMVAGVHGIGAKASCLSSLKFSIQTWRDNKIANVVFEKGNLISYKEKEIDRNFIRENGDSGTRISFIPDPSVFKEEPIKIEFEKICNQCEQISYLTRGLTFEISNGKQKKTFLAKNGILDLVRDKVKSPVHSTPLYFEIEKDGEKMEIAAQWTKDYECSFVFTNGLHNSEGGTPLTGAKTAITRTINSLLGKNYSGDMTRSGLIYAINIKTPHPSFANQTKTKIQNASLRSLADRAFSDGLKDFFKRNPKEASLIGEFLGREVKAEEAADKARKAILNHQKESMEARRRKIILPEKLKDARTLGEKATLFICEGDSALGALSLGRDVENVGLLPIRGKIINALKNPIEKVLENEEVKSIFMALGISYKGYNAKRLRYGSVGIAVDSDKDGLNIFCLLATFFYKLAPEFLQEGRLKWIKMPMYRIQYSKKVEYAFSEEEKNQILLANQGKYDMSKMKGIGENRKEDTEKTVFGSLKRWDTLTIEDMEKFSSTIEMLMGDDVKDRKEFIIEKVDFNRLIE